MILECRSHTISRSPWSFEELLDPSEEYEKGKKLNERYSLLTRKDWDEVAAIRETGEWRKLKNWEVSRQEIKAGKSEIKRTLNYSPWDSSNLHLKLCIREDLENRNRKVGMISNQEEHLSFVPISEFQLMNRKSYLLRLCSQHKTSLITSVTNVITNFWIVARPYAILLVEWIWSYSNVTSEASNE